MDGTIADFDKFFQECAGLSPSEYDACYGQVAFWEKLNSVYNFFSRLPKTPWADKLVEYGKELFFHLEYDFAILTALPRTEPEKVAEQKLAWMQSNYPEFDKSRILFCIGAHNKHKLCKPGDILIDDKKSNIKEWKKAGGYGIHVSYPYPEPDLYIEMLYLSDELKQKTSG